MLAIPSDRIRALVMLREPVLAVYSQECVTGHVSVDQDPIEPGFLALDLEAMGHTPEEVIPLMGPAAFTWQEVAFREEEGCDHHSTMCHECMMVWYYYFRIQLEDSENSFFKLDLDALCPMLSELE